MSKKQSNTTVAGKKVVATSWKARPKTGLLQGKALFNQYVASQDKVAETALANIHSILADRPNPDTIQEVIDGIEAAWKAYRDGHVAKCVDGLETEEERKVAIDACNKRLNSSPSARKSELKGFLEAAKTHMSYVLECCNKYGYHAARAAIQEKLVADGVKEKRAKKPSKPKPSTKPGSEEEQAAIAHVHNIQSKSDDALAGAVTNAENENAVFNSVMAGIERLKNSEVKKYADLAGLLTDAVEAWKASNTLANKNVIRPVKQGSKQKAA